MNWSIWLVNRYLRLPFALARYVSGGFLYHWCSGGAHSPPIFFIGAASIIAAASIIVPCMRRPCNVSRSSRFGLLIVCTRLLADEFSADGQGFSHKSSEENRRETLTGSLPVCIIRRKRRQTDQAPGEALPSRG